MQSDRAHRTVEVEVARERRLGAGEREEGQRHRNRNVDADLHQSVGAEASIKNWRTRRIGLKALWGQLTCPASISF